jgi:hypothetical protein
MTCEHATNKKKLLEDEEDVYYKHVIDLRFKRLNPSHAPHDGADVR